MSRLQLLKSISLFWLLIIGFVLVGCDPEEEPPAPIPDCKDAGAINYNPDAEAIDNSLCTYPDLELNVNYKVGEQDFYLDSVYHVGVNNVPVKLSVFKFYISNVRLGRSDGSELAIDDSYALVNPDYLGHPLGKAKVGEYESLTFDVGVDESTSERMPSDYEVGHPLSDVGMHRSDKGYLFVRAVGVVDTDFDGLYSSQVLFELGTVDLFRTVKGPIKLDVKDESSSIEIDVDLAKLFEGVDLSVSYSINPVKDKELALEVMNNFVDGIRF